MFRVSPCQLNFDIVGSDWQQLMDISIPNRNTYLVRLHGLPFGCTEEEIFSFFHPLPIAANGIVTPHDHRRGRETGEAFVAFYDMETASEALKRNRIYIRDRYVELLPASYGEMLRAMDLDVKDGSWEWDRYKRPHILPYGRQGRKSRCFSSGGSPRMRRYESWSAAHAEEGYSEPYGWRSGGGPLRRGRRGERQSRSRGVHSGRHNRKAPGGYALRMCGLPYGATEQDVVDFFYPLHVSGINLLLEYETGRASGEAIVEFCSLVDRDDALRRSLKYMGSRCIELFPRG